jgi:hypothetical protein
LEIGNALNLFYNKNATFNISKLEFEWEVPVKHKNFEFLILPLDAKIVTKNGIIFILRWNLLKKTLIFPFWGGICMGGTLWTQTSKFWVCHYLLNIKLLNKNAIRYVLRWDMFNKNDWISDFPLFPIQNLGEVMIRSLVQEISS